MRNVFLLHVENRHAGIDRPSQSETAETLHLTANLFLQCGNFSVILIVTLQSVSLFWGGEKTGHEREPSLFYLTIKSMKHRIGSHSTGHMQTTVHPHIRPRYLTQTLHTALVKVDGASSPNEQTDRDGNHKRDPD